MERHEIRIAAWKTALLVLGIAAFTVGGAAMAVYVDGIPEKAAGVLSVIFFGGLGSVALYRKSKGQGRVAVSDAGLEITLFGPKLRVIPWGDIESISTLAISKQQFTAVRLKNYRALLNDLSEEEAARALKDFGVLRAMSYAAIGVGGANVELKDAGDLFHFVGGSGRVKSVAEVLQHMRKKFGAEVLLGWNQRDRPAAEFVSYLNGIRLRNA